MWRTSAAKTATLMATLTMPMGAYAHNQMGYQLETPQMAATLHPSGGSLGMKVGPEKQITSGGMAFEILKVEAIGQGSPAQQAGIAVGDQVIAVDGRVFPDTQTFATYVGSMAPGHLIAIDLMPAGSGPQGAQRVGITVGRGGQAAQSEKEPRRGLSTGAKVAIGAGAIAVIGCYEVGCFKRLKAGLDAERERLRERSARPSTPSGQPR